MKSNRGGITLLILAVLALSGLGVWALKPRATHGDSRRADASAAASDKLVAATNAPAAVAAASVAKIAEANAQAPASPARDFIAQESQVAAANLPAPDPQALLAAERRRAAVMEGQRDEARALYADALKRADQLQREKTEAIRQRQAVDSELAQVAAERLGAERTQNRLALVAALAVALFLYVKLTHLAPGALAEAVADIKSGKAAPLQALDGVTTRLQQRFVSFLAHWKTKGPA